LEAVSKYQILEPPPLKNAISQPPGRETCKSRCKIASDKAGHKKGEDPLGIFTLI
jgi:hypothetical protein